MEMHPGSVTLNLTHFLGISLSRHDIFFPPIFFFSLFPSLDFPLSRLVLNESAPWNCLLQPNLPFPAHFTFPAWHIIPRFISSVSFSLYNLLPSYLPPLTFSLTPLIWNWHPCQYLLFRGHFNVTGTAFFSPSLPLLLPIFYLPSSLTLGM